ncbi:MAG: ketopantoate reductase family protein [Alphaproteobacteria bacterium]
MSLRILVVGAGAVGGYFGARLVEAGRDVTFLVRAGRARQIERDGLVIVSPFGDATLRPKLTSAASLAGPFDVILLGVKAYTLEGAVADMAPAVGPDTMIVPMLNGMRHLDVMAARFGEKPVLGGVCRVSTELDPAGRILQHARFQQLAYGEQDGSMTPRIARLDETLKGAGFDTEASTTIMQAMWDKWVQLATMGAVSCLLRGTPGEVATVPGGAQVARAILDECVAVADAWGRRPSDDHVSRLVAVVTDAGSKIASSMYRDLRKGAAVEADQIVGDYLARGVAKGLETPLLQAAAVNLAVYQAERARAA